MLTIKKKFIVAGVLTLLSMIGILALGHYQTSKLQTFDDAALHISRVQASMLQQRRDEKDFLARFDLKYRDNFLSNFSALEAELLQLQDAVIQAKLDASEIDRLKATFNAYKESFTQLVATQQTIGLTPTDGLYGKLRNAVHDAESAINMLKDSHLRADMLQLRRNEKDFMLRINSKYVDKFKKNYAVFLSTLNQVDHPSSAKDEIRKFMQQYDQDFMQLVAQTKVKGFNSKEGLLGVLREKVHIAEDLLDDISAQLNSRIEEEVGSLNRFMFITDAIGIGFASIVLVMLGWLTKSILLPLSNLASTMTQAATNNDLTLRMNISTEDEIGETSNAFNLMLEEFQTIIRNVNASALQISSASQEMSAITMQTSQAVQEQQSQTDQLAHSMQEMATASHSVSENAADAAGAASQANEQADHGQQVVSTTSNTIKTLAEGIQNAATALKQVEESSNNIGTVLDVIRGIAEQTNLLALNAAIEAARADEQGRGFAVVADEVRTLAGRTQNSTSEIQQMIESLQAGTVKSVKAMDESLELTMSSVEQTSLAGDALTSIVESVEVINNMSMQIASAVEEQTAVAEEINRNVSSINTVASQTTEASNQTAQTSEELAQLASDLHTLVKQFKA